MSEFFQQNKEATVKRNEPNVFVASVCPYCKQEIPPDAAFCPHCSSQISFPEMQNNQQGGYGYPTYQSYPSQFQKVDLRKPDQQNYYKQGYPYPENYAMNGYAPRYPAQDNGFFSPQSFDSSYPSTENSPVMRNKWIYFVLTLTLGMCGAHDFYENKIIAGISWNLPVIPFIIAVILNMSGMDNSTVIPIVGTMFIVNCGRYFYSLIKAIIRLVSTNGDFYPLKSIFHSH